MNREEIVCGLNAEMESLIRLRRHGLEGTRGYQERRARMKTDLLLNNIDITKELDPSLLILYRRYLE